MPGSNNENCKFIIKNVWEDSLDEEIAAVRDLIEEYPYISMDTEFPGVVARPIGTFKNTADYHYQTLRCNVDILRIIQLGITLSNERGELPPEVCTWQFNFKFNLSDDMYAQDSIELLEKSGIDFREHESRGIEVAHFGELLMTSGLVLVPGPKWISFHSNYDFGYLLKVLTANPLPESEDDFFEILRLFFPCIYDIKFLMKSCKNLKGGLQDVADDLSVIRIGPQHQAGSDSLLTANTFFKMRQVFFEDVIDDSKYMGHLYGIGTTLQQSYSVIPMTTSSSLASVLSTAGAIGNNNNNSADPIAIDDISK